MNAPQGQINLEQQPLETLYKLFRQRVNMATQIQQDLDGCRKDIGVINVIIQKKEEAEQIKKESKDPKEKEPEITEKKPDKKKKKK